MFYSIQMEGILSFEIDHFHKTFFDIPVLEVPAANSLVHVSNFFRDVLTKLHKNPTLPILATITSDESLMIKVVVSSNNYYIFQEIHGKWQ